MGKSVSAHVNFTPERRWMLFTLDRLAEEFEREGIQISRSELMFNILEEYLLPLRTSDDIERAKDLKASPEKKPTVSINGKSEPIPVDLKFLADIVKTKQLAGKPTSLKAELIDLARIGLMTLNHRG